MVKPAGQRFIRADRVSPVINHCPRNNPQINGDIILLGVAEVNLCLLKNI